MPNLPRRSETRRDGTPHVILPAPLLPLVGDAPIVVITDCVEAASPTVTGAFFYAPGILQDMADYRQLLRRWFAMVDVGSKLAIEVPHSFLSERETALPSCTHPSRRRLYTPASLLSEIEEALEPNSYRVRLLCDHDDGYDYEAEVPVGAQAILLVIERIASPLWGLDDGAVANAAAPEFAFEPARTRREIVTLPPRQRILILKLDHLGDFIMSFPALEKARSDFADADITLVVGSWNEAMARDLGLFETVIGFDAFPRNSSEEKVDLPGRIGDFKLAVPGEYDLAIDLRSDSDTRFFLCQVRAGIRAGIGTRSQFPYLDIFLPIDGSRHAFEAATDTLVGHAAFAATPACTHNAYRIAYDPNAKSVANPHDPCLVYGPYLRLPPGDYLYEPQIEIGSDDRATLVLDVAVDMERAAQAHARASAIPRLRFSIEYPQSVVEFRIFRDGSEIPPFSFYGGRLLRRGANSVLHQSEYLALLIDLVKMRTDRHGLLREHGVTT